MLPWVAKQNIYLYRKIVSKVCILWYLWRKIFVTHNGPFASTFYTSKSFINWSFVLGNNVQVVIRSLSMGGFINSQVSHLANQLCNNTSIFSTWISTFLKFSNVMPHFTFWQAGLMQIYFELMLYKSIDKK